MASVSSKIKLINVNGIGEIQILRSRRNKKLCISINKSKVVKVSIPYRIGFSEGERFLIEKLEWIKKTIQKIETNDFPQKIINSHSEFNSRSRKLKFITSFEPIFNMILKNDEIQIHYPEGIDLNTEQSQLIIKKFILEALILEAKSYFPKRVSELAKIYDFQYNLVKIRNSRTRWGSCSYNNNINLSLYLILLPDYLSDYVILHELVHTKHKNHSLKFWKSFDKLIGDAKEKSKLLKNYKLEQFI
jgi:predicted metal-dependent hydrolase